MIRFPLVALGASTLLLQACMFSPGMHMDTDRLTSQDSAENSMVEMVQITPKLIAQDQAVNDRLAVPQPLLDYSRKITGSALTMRCLLPFGIIPS